MRCICPSPLCLRQPVLRGQALAFRLQDDQRQGLSSGGGERAAQNVIRAPLPPPPPGFLGHGVEVHRPRGLLHTDVATSPAALFQGGINEVVLGLGFVARRSRARV